MSIMLFLIACAPTKEAIQPSTSAINYTLITEKVIKDYNLTFDKLRKLQVYNGSAIILERAISESSTEVVLGKLIVRENKRFDQIELPQYTEGVIIAINPDGGYQISFEEGRDDLYFVFKPNRSADRDGPYMAAMNPNNDGSYYLMYGGKKYIVKSSTLVDLYLNQENLSSDGGKARVIQGRSVLTSKRGRA